MNTGSDDTLEIRLIFAPGGAARGADAVAPILAAIDAHAGEFLPDTFLAPRRFAYHRPAVLEKIPQLAKRGVIAFSLVRTTPFEVAYEFNVLEDGDEIGGRLTLVMPLDEIVNAGPHAEETLIEMIAAIAAARPVIYGYGHPKADLEHSRDPLVKDPFATPEIREVHWLNVYGSQLVAAAGIDKLKAVPHKTFVQLANGTVVFSTSALSGVLADSGRRAQARALAHLGGTADEAASLAELQARSQQLQPVAQAWDADIAPLLQRLVERSSPAERPALTQRYNDFHPPAVTEYVKAKTAPAADVADVERAIDEFRNEHAEQLIALVSKSVPAVLQPSPASLPEVDLYFLDQNYPAKLPRSDIDALLVPAVGAYIGELLVNHLKGRWVPRHKLQESQVIIGDTAFLPFQRAQHYLQDDRSPLEYSLTQYYAAAQRLAD